MALDQRDESPRHSAACKRISNNPPRKGVAGKAATRPTALLGWMPVLLCAVLAACSLRGLHPPTVPARFEPLDAAAPELMRRHRVPGIAIAVVENGRVAWAKGYGWADVEGRRPATERTVFQAASVSKPVSAWVAMKLVEDGKASLDAPVSRYLTRWHLPASGFDNDGVTLRRLLSHTAGLSIGGYLGFAPGQPLQTLEASLDSAADAGNQPLAAIFPPGRGWHYSGGGYTLMELLVEQRAGQPFADAAQGMLASLGMSSSTFHRTFPRQEQAATGYDRNGNPVPTRRFTALAAAGLWTTATDLGQMLATLMRQVSVRASGNAPLAPATVRQMLAPQPHSSNDLLFSNSRWGLGYGLKALSPAGDVLVFHPGDNIPAWHSMIAAVPARGIGLAVLTNGEGGRELRFDLFCHWYRLNDLPPLAECSAHDEPGS